LRGAESRFGGCAGAHRDAERDEAGAILILALVFLLVGIIVVGALTSALTNDLSNSAAFKSVRSLQYAARSATNFAIQSIRYTPLLSTSQTLNASPPNYCWGAGPSSTFPQTIDGVSGMTVWCSTVWNATSAQTRVVTFSTCPGSSTAVLCAQHPYLQAVVTFDDYPPGISAPTTAECVVYCGASMDVNSWLWSPVVPTVTGISVTGSTPPSGPITGGTAVTITGSGFGPGAAVDFVEESGGVPANDNVVLSVPTTGVTVNGPSSITAIAPAVTEGSTYYVTVTTPTGTSAYSANDVFTYQPAPPTVTGISPNSGLIGGGNAVTITGSGFLNGATINFVEESNGAPVSPTVSVPAAYVSVTGSTSITTVSPPVSATGTYFVTVTTSDGTSTPGTVCPSYPPPTGTPCDTFQYGMLTPTISSITPTSGSVRGGTSVTVTGVGFVGGNTVTFVQFNGLTGSGNPITNGYSVNASSVTVNESGVTGTSTMTVVAPAVSSAGTYYVDVTTSQGTSAYSGESDVFTYS
jgi:Tfp pilus assembly protein PilX